MAYVELSLKMIKTISLFKPSINPTSIRYTVCQLLFNCSRVQGTLIDGFFFQTGDIL